MTANVFQLARLSSLPRPSTKWQWGGCLVLAALVLGSAVRLVLLLVSPPALPEVRFPPARQATAAAAIKLYPDSAVPVAAGEQLSEASFNGRLFGVIQLGEHSLASIAVGGGKEKVYRVGDSLAPGVTLQAIERFRVVVRERGVLRQLTLASLLDNNTPIQVQEPQAGAQSELEHLPSIVATPVLSDGVSGLRIDQLGADLESLDLVHQGDLVTAVDGVGLSTLMADKSALNRLVKREALTLTVMRNGRELSLDVDGEMIRSIINGN